MRVTGEVYADAVRYCPVRTGRLQSSIRWEVRPGVGIVSVGTNYWHYQEFGAPPHIIRPRGPGYPLRFFWQRVGRWVAFWKVNHPGNPAVAYMRRALWQRR